MIKVRRVHQAHVGFDHNRCQYIIKWYAQISQGQIPTYPCSARRPDQTDRKRDRHLITPGKTWFGDTTGVANNERFGVSQRLMTP